MKAKREVRRKAKEAKRQNEKIKEKARKKRKQQSNPMTMKRLRATSTVKEIHVRRVRHTLGTVRHLF